MTPYELLLVLGSALLHAVWSVAIKGSRNPLVFNLLQKPLPLLLLLASLPFVALAEIPRPVWAAFAGTSVAHGLYFYWMSRAYEQGDLTLVYPIARSTPAFMPLLAAPLLGESVSLLGAVGIAAVVAGLWLVQIGGRLESRPTRSVHSESVQRTGRRAQSAEPGAETLPPKASEGRGPSAGGQRARGPAGLGRDVSWAGFASPAAGFAYLTLAATLAYSLFDKLAMAGLAERPWSSPVPRPLFYCLLLYAGSAVFFLPLALRRVGARAVLAAVPGQLGAASLAATVSLVGYGLILQALETANVNYVVAARQTSVIFALALGVFWLGEAPGRTRVLGGVATAVGVALIALSR